MEIYTNIIKKLHSDKTDLNEVLLNIINLEWSGIINWQSSFNQESFGSYFVRKCFESIKLKDLIEDKKFRTYCLERITKLNKNKRAMFINKMVSENRSYFNPNFIKMFNSIKESNAVYITKVAKFNKSLHYFEKEDFTNLFFDLAFFIDYSNYDYFIKNIFDENDINKKIIDTSIDLKEDEQARKGFLTFFKESVIEPINLDLNHNDTFNHWVASDADFNLNIIQKASINSQVNVVGLAPIDNALTVNNKAFIDTYFTSDDKQAFIEMSFKSYDKKSTIKKSVIDYTSYVKNSNGLSWHSVSWFTYLRSSEFKDKQVHRLLLPWLFLDSQGYGNNKEDKKIKKKIVNDFYEMLNIIQAKDPKFIFKTNNQGENLLHQLAHFLRNKKSLVELNDFFIYLIKSGLDINAKDNEGQTPLFHFTAQNIKLVSELIENHSLDITVINNKGENLFEATRLSKSSKYRKVLESLYLKKKSVSQSKPLKRRVL